MKSKRTKECEIPKAVKEAVSKRDTFKGGVCCVLCGTPAPPENPLAFSNAHFVPRSKGGLGIEKNIITLCPHCHRQFDQSTDRDYIRTVLRNYLKSEYGEWNEEDLIYRR